MSSNLSRFDTVIIDSVIALRSFLNNIENLPPQPPSLFVNLEETKLGRHGTLSIISLYVAPKKTVYLVDVLSLGSLSFSTTNDESNSLKTLFESPTTPKVFFDVRNDSDALFGLYQISVGGVEGVQLMELATRKGPKDFVAGLAKCVQRDCTVSNETKSQWQETKTRVSQLFDSQNGQGHDVLNERPLKPETILYCANDVVLLPDLYDVYDTKLRMAGKRFWLLQMQAATKDRVKLSQSATYNGHTKDNARGPWDRSYIEEAIEHWNATGDDSEDYDDYQDTAQDCIGWENDMIKGGEWF